MQLLVINPNTSAGVSAVLQHHVSLAAPPGVRVRTATAAFGASYIASETSYVVATHAVLDTWAVHAAAHGVPDAVLVGCFGDPGVFGLRELTPRPVLGLAEAAMRLAAERGRYAIVTGGAAWAPMLERLARALSPDGRLDGLLAGVHTVAPSGAQLAADRPAAIALLAEACRIAAAEGVQSVILGGAGLAGMAAEVQPAVPVPVIDSVQAGVEMLLRAVAQRDARGAEPGAADGAAAPLWTGLSPALSDRLG